MGRDKTESLEEKGKEVKEEEDDDGGERYELIVRDMNVMNMSRLAGTDKVPWLGKDSLEGTSYLPLGGRLFDWIQLFSKMFFLSQS